MKPDHIEDSFIQEYLLGRQKQIVAGFAHKKAYAQFIRYLSPGVINGHVLAPFSNQQANETKPTLHFTEALLHTATGTVSEDITLGHNTVRLYLRYFFDIARTVLRYNLARLLRRLASFLALNKHHSSLRYDVAVMLARCPIGASGRTQCNSISLDDFCKTNSVIAGVLYLDMAGFETHALLGGIDTLREQRPVIIIRMCAWLTQKRGFSAHYVLQLLKSLGYQPAGPAQQSAWTFEDIEKKVETHKLKCHDLVFNSANQANDISVLPDEQISMPERKLSDYRVLLAYTPTQGRYQDKKQAIEDWLARLRQRGFLVDGFPLFVEQGKSWLTSQRIVELWNSKDANLLRLYDRLGCVVGDYDILLNYGGANLHPEFIDKLPSFCATAYFDDPEASEIQSRYTAHAYDHVFVGNAGCLDMYQGWNVSSFSFWPIGVRDDEYDASLTEDFIRERERSIPLIFLGERDPSRDILLLPLLKRYPQTLVYGYGWPSGILPHEQQRKLYIDSRIGWSMDQSIGPATSRTYRLPANGVLLIGNNTRFLDKVFVLGKEAIGFETVQECIEKTEYYLRYPEVRTEIAINGWRRTMANYTETALWKQMLSVVAPRLRI